MVLKMKAHTHIYTLCIFIRILFIFQAFCCGNLVYACICVINQSTHWCAYWGPCLAFAGGLLGMERPRTWSSVLLYLELVNWINNLLLSGNWSWKGFRCNVLPCSKPLICTGLNSFFWFLRGLGGPQVCGNFCHCSLCSCAACAGLSVRQGRGLMTAAFLTLQNRLGYVRKQVAGSAVWTHGDDGYNIYIYCICYIHVICIYIT